MPNCKELTPLSIYELVYKSDTPYKLCTFSRVMKEKGIEDAIEAVKAVNRKLGKTVYTLDIYGQVDVEEIDWFDTLKNSFPEYVTYGGVVQFDKSVEVLKNYFALLFPTHFYTEGIPGTIIDAYAAGIPVISARWQSFYDIVDDRVTGIGYEFNCIEEFEQILFDLEKCVDGFNKLKINCLEKSKHFLPNDTIKIICEKLI